LAVDIRDIIQVPKANLAVEYLPGWFSPLPELTNAPTIPAALPC
jgi:hypothetical protein